MKQHHCTYSLILFSAVIIALLSRPNYVHARAQLVDDVFHRNERVTELQVYVQDILTGPTPSNVQVARARSTPTSPTFFGLVAVLDDPVRTGPTNDSEIVGRAQGIFAFSSLEEQSFHMSFDLVFTGGEYNGSVLNVVGRNPYLHDHRELAIVGGSGLFRLARGFIGVRTVSMDSSTGDAFFQYNITVLHYDHQ